MSIALYIAGAAGWILAAFLWGLLWGQGFGGPQARRAKTPGARTAAAPESRRGGKEIPDRAEDADLHRTQREWRNFLLYDGSRQEE